MTVHIGYRFYPLKELLQALKKDRQTLICDLPFELRIRQFFESEFSITGKEERPLSDEEVEKLVEHYKSFQKIFEEKGLLPVKKLNL
ncbi:MAG: hypothetical protein WAV46_01735 [Candidatus Moraniibacteriota bacterium]